MKINLPNQITISRLVLAVVFFVLLAGFDIQSPRPWMMHVSLALLIIAGVTDWLDGYLARKRNQVTPLGRILDPFVDKILVCGAYLFFAGRGFITADGIAVTAVAPWMVVVITGRELLVTGLRGVAESQGRAFGADLWGKLKTVIQLVTAGIIMSSVALGSPQQPAGPFSGLIVVAVWTTIVITAYSGFNYCYKARDLLAEA